MQLVNKNSYLLLCKWSSAGLLWRAISAAFISFMPLCVLAEPSHAGTILRSIDNDPSIVSTLSPYFDDIRAITVSSAATQFKNSSEFNVSPSSTTLFIKSERYNISSRESKRNIDQRISRRDVKTLPQIFNEIESPPEDLQNSSFTPWVVPIDQDGAHLSNFDINPSANGKSALRKVLQRSLKNWWYNGQLLAFSNTNAIKLPDQLASPEKNIRQLEPSWDYRVRASKNRIKFTLERAL